MKRKTTSQPDSQARLLEASETAGATVAAVLKAYAGGDHRQHPSGRPGQHGRSTSSPLLGVTRSLVLGLGIGLAFGLARRTRAAPRQGIVELAASDLAALLESTLRLVVTISRFAVATIERLSADRAPRAVARVSAPAATSAASGPSFNG